MENKNNLDLWERVEKTDPDFVKDASIGKRKITAIDPQYQLKNATREFGQYGSKWGLKDIEWGMIDIGDTKLATISAIFFTPNGEVATGNSMKMSYMSKGYGDKSGYIVIDDDYRKKLMTNTLSKELSRLGFNADVFMGKWDDEKYVQTLAEEKAQGKAEIEKARVTKDLEEIKDVEKLREYYTKNKGLGVEIEKLITDKGKELKKEND